MDEKKTKIAENLGMLRREAGETQKELGDAIGVSDKTISKWESGESEPGLSAVLALTEHFRVSADALIAGEPKKDDPYGGLDARETALRYFSDTVRHTFELSDGSLKFFIKDHAPLVPPDQVKWRGSFGDRTGVTTSEIFSHAVSHREAALCVTLMQNADNWKWLERDEERLCGLFSALAKPGMMKLVRFLHTQGAPDRITAEYAAKACGCSAEDARALLRLIGYWEETVVFPDGERSVFVFSGSPYLMTALNAMHESMNHQDGCCMYNSEFRPVFPDADKDDGKEA